MTAGGGDAEGLLPSLSQQPSAFAHGGGESTIVGISGVGGRSPSASPSREHHSAPLTPRRASSMLRGAASAAAAPTRQAISSVLSSWVSRRFLGGLAVLLPIAVSVFATVWFLNFFDRLFAPPLEALLGFRVVGLGFATSMLFIFATGVVASSYVGGALISLGEWVIRRLPLVKHVFSAAKQISAAISPSGVEGGGESGVGGGSFRECVLVKNPRLGNFMLAFVTGATRLRGAPLEPPYSSSSSGGPEGTAAGKERDLDLVAVYAATNHFVFGDVFLVPRSVSRRLLFLFLPPCFERERGERERERKKKSSPWRPPLQTNKKNSKKKKKTEISGGHPAEPEREGRHRDYCLDGDGPSQGADGADFLIFVFFFSFGGEGERDTSV